MPKHQRDGQAMTSAPLLSWNRRTVRQWCRHDWLSLVGPGQVEEILRLPPGERYHAKQGRSTGRWVFGTGSCLLRVFLKRHLVLPWTVRLLAWLFPQRCWSPAWQEFRNLLWARQHGLAVPEPVAVAEARGPGWTLRSYLAVEELTDRLPLHEAVACASRVLDPAAFAVWKRTCARELARMVRRLHQAGRYHKDLYLCHFFVRRPSPENVRVRPGDIALIDLHRMREHLWLGWYFRVKDLAQLLFSTWDLPQITDRDRMCFFRLYTGRQPDRLLRRAVWWKARQYWRRARYRFLGHRGHTTGPGAGPDQSGAGAG